MQSTWDGICRVFAVAGAVVVVIGFFLPWEPGGRSSLWTGVKIHNLSGETMNAGLKLLPGETFVAGPYGSGKIISADGTSERTVGRKWTGADLGWWGYSVLALGTICSGLTIAGAVLKRALLTNGLLFAAGSLGIGLLVIKTCLYLLPSIRAGNAFAESLELLAPFGDLGFCVGLIVSGAGFFVTSSAALVLLLGGLSENGKGKL